MKQPVTMAVLSVSPHYGDHDALEEIFRSTEGEWKLYKSLSLQPATVLLRLHKIPIVVCECDLQPGSWRELQERTFSMPDAPLVIVTSRLADERMWSEVLNLGGWDVLAKPFDRTEVARVVETAGRHWMDRRHVPAAIRQLRRLA
jgi:FixJ family two-component response regulator